jgi:hypothetical protein
LLIVFNTNVVVVRSYTISYETPFGGWAMRAIQRAQTNTGQRWLQFSMQVFARYANLIPYITQKTAIY